MRLSLIKIVVLSLFIMWCFIAYSVLKVGSYLPANQAPVVSQEKGTYFESLYYSTLYDEEKTSMEGDAFIQTSQDGSYKATSKADQITQKAEKELEKDFLDVISTYLENVNYYRGELRKANPLNKFGFYKPFNEKYLEFYQSGKNKYKKAHLGLMNEPCYCEIVDFYNLYHSENLFSERYIFTDYNPEGLTRKGIIKTLGKDEMPAVYLGMPRSDSSQRKFFLSKKITMFYTKSDNFHYFHEIGKNFLGFSQMYNHIPGNGAVRRFDVFNHLSREYEKTLGKNPKCIDYTDTFVRTYKMSDKSQCQEFFKEAYDASENATQTLWFISDYDAAANDFKRNRTSQAWREAFAKDYEQGGKCGEKKSGKLMIQDVQKKFLKNGTHVVLLRYYVLVSSTNPLRVYIHDGHFSSYKTEVFFNGEHPEKEKDSKKNATTDQIKSGDIIVDFEDNIQEYLNTKSNNSSADGDKSTEKSIISKIEEENTMESSYKDTYDDEPTENFPESSKIPIQDFLLPFFNETGTRERIKQKLLKQATKAIVHAIKIAEPFLYKSSGVFELFGATFIVDESLHPRLLNLESSPNLFGEARGELLPMFRNLLYDVFEIEYSYLRSRMVRFQKFLYEYHSDVVLRKNVTSAEYERRFAEMNQNIVEPEYAIEPKSKLLKKVLDLSPGSNLTFAAYFEQECLALLGGAHA